jgi:hypothetical protein
MALNLKKKLARLFQLVSSKVIFGLLLVHVVGIIVQLTTTTSKLGEVSEKIIPFTNGVIFLFIIIKIYGFADKIETIDTDKGVKEIYNDYTMGAISTLLLFNTELRDIEKPIILFLFVAIGSPALLLFNKYRNKLVKTFAVQKYTRKLMFKRMVFLLLVGVSLITTIMGLIFMFIINFQAIGVVLF